MYTLLFPNFNVVLERSLEGIAFEQERGEEGVHGFLRQQETANLLGLTVRLSTDLYGRR